MNASYTIEPVQTAVSRQTDSALAASDLAAQLSDPALGFVLFFCSAEYDLVSLARSLEQSLVGIKVIGCTTAGEITAQGYEQHSITALGFNRHCFAVDAALIESLDQFGLVQAQALTESLIARCLEHRVAPIKGHSFAITLLDGLSSQEEMVLLALNSALGSIPHFGGSAGDDIHLANTHVYFDGEFHTKAAVVILINTLLDFEVFTTHHMLPLQQKFIVTQADPATRTVFELNAEPAAEEYARLVGVPVAELDHQIFALNPLAVRIGQEFYVRSIQRVNLDLSLTFYCAVENGIVLTAMEPGDMLPNLEAEFQRIEAQIGAPLITLGCDCFLRKLEAQCRGTLTETSDFLVRHRVVGFNTYGEQFDGMHINQTFTGVVIGRSQRYV